MSEEIAKITYASTGYLSPTERKVDTAETPKKEGKFETMVRAASQKVTPVQPISEAEPPRRYSKAEVQYQIDQIKEILDAQKPKQE